VVGGIVGYVATPKAAPATTTVTVTTTVKETVTTTTTVGTGAAATVTETVTVTTTAAPTAPGLAELRRELAQKYATAKPGEKFLVGHVVWTLAHEPPKYDAQAGDQAARQLGLEYKILEVGTGVPATIEGTESLIAAGAKGISFWAPAIAAIKEISKICNENKVFAATAWCRDPDCLPGDLGPYWFLEFSTMSDEMSFQSGTMLLEKMRRYGKTKLLHVQASKTIATDSQSLINQGLAIAWRRYPEIVFLGHFWGEWAFEPGRKAGEDALAVRTDYEALWGHNDDQALGTASAFEERGINIGPFAASRDAILKCCERVAEGTWFSTSLTEFQYFGGKRVVAIYDAATGVSYPLRDEMIQSPWVTEILNMTDPKIKAENEELIKTSGLWWHPTFVVCDASKLIDFLKISEKYPAEEYPYDFRLMSIGKCQELGLTYDVHGGNTLTANNFYYIPMSPRFQVDPDPTSGKNTEEFRKQFRLTLKHFLDLSIDTHDELLKKWAEAEADGLKLEPVWGR